MRRSVGNDMKDNTMSPELSAERCRQALRVTIEGDVDLARHWLQHTADVAD